MSRAHVQPGLVADRIARLRAITIRNYDASQWSRSPQPYDQLDPSSGEFLEKVSIASGTAPTAPSSKASRRTLVDYVSNDNLTRQILRPSMSLITLGSPSTISGLDSTDLHARHLTRSDQGADPASVLPLNIVKPAKDRPEPNKCCRQSEADKKVVVVGGAPLVNGKLLEPQPHRLPPTRRDTLAERIEQRVHSMQWPSSSHVPSVSVISCHDSGSDWTTTAAPTEKASQASLNSMTPEPSVPVIAEADSGSSGQSTAILHVSKRTASDQTNVDAKSVAGSAVRSGLGKRIRKRFSSFTKSERGPTASGNVSRDASAESMAAARGTESKTTGLKPKQQRSSMRLFSKVSKADTSSSCATETATDKRLDGNGELHTLYTSARIDLRACGSSHENVEIKDDRGNCVMVFTVAGGGKKEPVRLEMSPPARKGKHRRCEACDRH